MITEGYLSEQLAAANLSALTELLQKDMNNTVAEALTTTSVGNDDESPSHEKLEKGCRFSGPSVLKILDTKHFLDIYFCLINPLKTR